MYRAVLKKIVESFNNHTKRADKAEINHTFILQNHTKKNNNKFRHPKGQNEGDSIRWK